MATEEDKVNSGALITLVGVSTFAMIAVTLAVTAIARDEIGKAQEEKEGSGATQYHDMRSAQLGGLANGVTIEQSMQKVVQGLASDPGSATPPTPVTTATAAPDAAAAAGGASASAAPAAGAPAAAGGAAATPAPAPAPAEHGSTAGGAPAAAPKSKPVAPAAKPLAPKPAPGQPLPAAPATPAPATPVHG